MRDIRFLLKTHYSNSRALIIGINRYENASPLSFAVSDAAEIRDVLINDLSFLEKDITFLIDDDATQERILRAFMRFTSDDIDLDERIFIFFAGHGHTRTGIRGEVGYLVPYDADYDNFSTFIRWDELTRNAELIRAKHMLFIMDACYGGLAVTRNTQPGSTRFLKDMMLRYSRQVLTAGKADEVVADSGGPLPNHSVFTGHLIEGLQGKATSGDGVLTASGLMSYVYGKVANDRNSNQTPHYGYFDGDGDFILRSPQLAELEESERTDIDRLIVVPYSEDDFSNESTASKMAKVKKLLASDSTSIELHDYLIEEVRRFQSTTDDDNFKVQGQYSKDELIERISRYEDLGNDLALLTACVAYWAKPSHKAILQKTFARSTDRLDLQSDLSVWRSLRWYPLIISLYCSGIAAVEGKRYDSLANIFYTIVDSSESHQEEWTFAEAVANGISNFARSNVFKQLPGHERYYAPMSEYLFKILQPKLDDILYIGMSYERSFDEFEVLFALVVADLRKQRYGRIWAPVGRFGWKQNERIHGPLERIVTEGLAKGNDWEPIQAGLFGGDPGRFESVADEFLKLVSSLSWF